MGLAALTHDQDEVAAVIAASPAEIVHVHAGIGWEGHDLVTTARAAGTPAFSSRSASPSGVCPPSWTITPATAPDSASA